MTERQTGSSEIQHIRLPYPLHPRQFSDLLTESFKNSAFTIYKVQFDEAKQVIGLEPTQDLGKGNEGTFILNNSEGGRYLAQFESAYSSVNHVLSYQAEVRRSASHPSLLNLSEAIEANQPVLHYQYQEQSTPSGTWMQPTSAIEFDGSDEFLQKFVLNLQKPQATNEEEPETPTALSNLLLSAQRAKKAGNPTFITINEEDAEEILSTGIKIEHAM